MVAAGVLVVPGYRFGTCVSGYDHALGKRRSRDAQDKIPCTVLKGPLSLLLFLHKKTHDLLAPNTDPPVFCSSADHIPHLSAEGVPSSCAAIMASNQVAPITEVPGDSKTGVQGLAKTASMKAKLRNFQLLAFRQSNTWKRISKCALFLHVCIYFVIGIVGFKFAEEDEEWTYTDGLYFT